MESAIVTMGNLGKSAARHTHRGGLVRSLAREDKLIRVAGSNLREYSVRLREYIRGNENVRTFVMEHVFTYRVCYALQ